MNKNWGILLAGFIFVSCNTTDKSKTSELSLDTETQKTGAEQGIEPVASAESAPQLPSFQLKDAKGNLVELSGFKGKKILVNLWASWCPPCRREMPSLQNLYKKADPATTAFFMVALDDDFMNSLNWLQGQSLNVPAYFPAGQMPELFNVQAIPATFIFDENGKLLKKVEGAEDYDVEAYHKLFGAKS